MESSFMCTYRAGDVLFNIWSSHCRSLSIAYWTSAWHTYLNFASLFASSSNVTQRPERWGVKWTELVIKLLTAFNGRRGSWSSAIATVILIGWYHREALASQAECNVYLGFDVLGIATWRCNGYSGWLTMRKSYGLLDKVSKFYHWLLQLESDIERTSEG